MLETNLQTCFGVSSSESDEASFPDDEGSLLIHGDFTDTVTRYQDTYERIGEELTPC